LSCRRTAGYTTAPPSRNLHGTTNEKHAHKRATVQKWRDCSTQEKTGNTLNILLCGDKLRHGQKPNDGGVPNAAGASAAQNPANSTKSEQIGNPVTDFSPGPNPAGMQMRAQAPSDYLLRADSFDSLCGEFFCNTSTRWRPDGGTPTWPSITISLAVSLRP
jgi:hypothetical protein